MYIALKNLNLSGVGYLAGEEIPAGALAPGRVTALLRSGYIAEASADISKGTTIPVVITKTGETVELTSGEVDAIISILQDTADAGVEYVGQSDEVNLLTVLEAVDSRKTVRAAAKSRLEELKAGDPEDDV